MKDTAARTHASTAPSRFDALVSAQGSRAARADRRQHAKDDAGVLADRSAADQRSIRRAAHSAAITRPLTFGIRILSASEHRGPARLFRRRGIRPPEQPATMVASAKPTRLANANRPSARGEACSSTNNQDATWSKPPISRDAATRHRPAADTLHASSIETRTLPEYDGTPPSAITGSEATRPEARPWAGWRPAEIPASPGWD